MLYNGENTRRLPIDLRILCLKTVKLDPFAERSGDSPTSASVSDSTNTLSVKILSHEEQQNIPVMKVDAVGDVTGGDTTA